MPEIDRRALLAAFVASWPGIAAAQGIAGAVEAPDGDWVDRAIAGRWTGDLDGMIERRAIRVLVVPSKTNFFLDRGHQYGITHDLAREFEKKLNQDLKLGARRLTVFFVPTSRDRILTDLVEGRGDIAAANLTETPERSAMVEFADPFRKDARELVVAYADVPLPANVDDLSGREVLVREASSYRESLESLNTRLVLDGRAPVRISFAHPLLEDEDILEMVQAGLVELTVVDEHKLAVWTKVFDRIRVAEAAVLRSDGRIGWAIRKHSPRLRKAVDGFVRTAAKGTTLGNVINQRYLGSTRWVQNAAAEEERARFLAMVDVFKRYAGQYDFDPLMIGAQAFQESRLRQDLRSKAGAVGVMQVLPSTAKDPNIGIPDVTILENNVNAGVKYLRFMLDRYFADATMDDFNRTMFAFASYNAGPAKIAKLRKRAAEKGLDPNVWFGNVELVVAEKIGRETVQYVANILKYYVVYRRITDQRAALEAIKGAQPEGACVVSTGSNACNPSR